LKVGATTAGLRWALKGRRPEKQVCATREKETNGMKTTLASLALAIVLCGLAIAQEPPPPAEGPSTQMGRPMAGRPGGGGRGMGFRIPAPGKWWKDSALMQKIGVTDEQVQKIEKIFQDHRLQLIDLHAALEKQEAILEPLVEADQPDEGQVIAQIDKVAQARANLEKSNAQMLLAIRRVLSVDQWKKLRNLPGVARFQPGHQFRPPAPRPSAPLPPAAPPPGE
jgi:Spy/CpxP family protein refolding chaperone